MLKVHFTRSKIFFNTVNGAERRYQAAPPGVYNNIPDWVKTAPGWDTGVADGSIVDLTPPKPAPVVEPAKQEPESVGDDQTGDDQTGDDQTGDDQDDGKLVKDDDKPAKSAKTRRLVHGLQK